MKYRDKTLLLLCCVFLILLFDTPCVSARSMWKTDWSPDGGRIVFGMDGDIWMIDAGGGEPVNLTPAVDDECSYPVFSPDGANVVYSRYISNSSLYDSSAGLSLIVSMDIDSGQCSTLFENASAASFSPDGHYVSYIKNWMFNAVYDFQTEREMVFDFNGESPPFFCGAYASFSADASHIVTQFKYAKNALKSNRYKLYTISIETGEVEMLDIGDSNVVYPEYSPGGDRLLFSQYGPDGRYHLKVHHTASGVNLGIDDEADGETICGSWSPDGESICYIFQNDNKTSLRVYDCGDCVSKELYTISTETGVGTAETVPATVELYGNVPNPFNPSTSIVFGMAEEGGVDLVIYNAVGQKVRTLLDNAVVSPGRHDVLWDGADDDGIAVSSGVYCYRIVSGGCCVGGVMTLMK